ncbi:mycofactocin system FadH/OYE family oxidoreductase 2 [Pseudonocardia alni]|uniref:Mycofactocin system FadH/OYE family oxidoreductase 2 n=1 Tax=Pseudonocardia alni TaxID=33907 RepID=A0AA44UPT7_PSEA5|nr:mycofactocin system FadH/OYE family oxidoreductase 2 [Pseudonocardia alni]
MLFGPHETNLGDAARGITADHVAYYAARAAGGAGIVVVEPASVHASDHPYAYAPAAFPAASPVPAVSPGPAASSGPAAASGRVEMQLSGSRGSSGPAELHLGDRDGARVPAAAGWAAVVAACRPHGTLVLAGLAHAGGQGSSAHSGHPLWAPSPVPDVVSREVPVAMGSAEIGAVVRGFADAARAAVDSGVDGVEISAGQHSVLRQFCSGLTNHRDDAYGRDRTLLLREVLDAVRAAIGPDPLLALRLCVDELAPWAGITPGDGLALARSVADRVDLLVPVVGSALSVAATRPDLHTPEAFLRARCGELRRALGGATTVVLAGSVVTPALADDALSSGDADIVEMTRAQVADPRLVALTRAGTPERIRPCLLTNALAAARDPRNPVVGDELEPRSGHERTDPDPDPDPDPDAEPEAEPEPVPPRSAERGPDAAAGPGHLDAERALRSAERGAGARRPVLVVGGGPAGLEAARTLALRGHPVTLHERTDRLGGLLPAAAVLPGRDRLALPVPWWAAELDRLGVDVRLGSEVDPAVLGAARARGEAVVLATGSRPSPPVVDADVPVLTAAELCVGVARSARVVVPAAAGRGVGAAEGVGDPGADRATHHVVEDVEERERDHQPEQDDDDRRGGHRNAVVAVLAAARVPRNAPVLVADPLGDWTGPGVAELLAGAGYRVVLSTPDAVAGHQLGRCGDMAAANARLERAGVRRALFTRPGAVRGGVAELVDVHTAAVTTVPCAAVVDCGPRLPQDTLPALPGCHLAGDRVAPRTLAEAVREGRRAAFALADADATAGGTARAVTGLDPGPGPVVLPGSGARDTVGAGGAASPPTAAASPGPALPAPVSEGAEVPRPRLGDPLRLGRAMLRNRIVFTAHLTGFAENGMPTDRHTAYYAARAAGGAALVITEEHAVRPGDRPYERLIRGHDPAVLPGYRALTDAVHAHGALVLAQLNHNGAQGSGMYSRTAVVGPSPVPDPMFREVPAELDAAGIGAIVDAFADVAARCVEGGFDGVELQCSHASLLRLFLSPATNRRTDAWGRDRAKLVLDVVAAVRAAIGPDPVLGLRIGVDERIEGGITPADGADLARRLAATGQVDHLNTSIGVATSTLHLIEPSMHTPPGYAGHLAATLRRAVRAAGADLPVIGVGRFTTPAEAAAALDRGECDLVGVARGQIADPGFANKALTGRPVRRCVGCNQDCIGRVGLNLPLGCAVDPAAGRERLVPPTRAAGPGAGRVLVVGAGPAGLAAAAALAGRGHRVLLAERAGTPGGRLALAATAPGRAELGHVVADLLREAHAAGAEIRYGTTVDRGFVEELDPAAVVVATGSVPAVPSWDPERLTVPVDDVLAGVRLPPGPVLVVDELGFHQATSVAELLAARGHAVEVVTPALVVGQDLGLTLDREGFRRRAHAAGIRCRTDLAVLGVLRRGEQSRGEQSCAEPDCTVELLHHPTGRTERRDVGAVVAATATVPATRLWSALAGGPWPVHRIGDALAPRRFDAAIREGRLVDLAPTAPRRTGARAGRLGPCSSRI